MPEPPATDGRAFCHACPARANRRAALPQARYAPGPESLEVALVAPPDIPWEELAFRSTEFTLRRYFEDKAAGRDGHYFTTLDRRVPPPRA